MPTIRYAKYEATLQDLDAADLMQMLQDRLTGSGFDQDPFDPDPEAGTTMEDLYEAIAQALHDRDLIPDEMLEEAFDADDWMDSALGRTVRDLAGKLEAAGFVRAEQGRHLQTEGGDAEAGEPDDPGEQRFALTDAAADLLGQRTFEHLVGGRGGDPGGVHRTRRTDAGVETTGASRPWSYGDAMHLDVAETFKSALLRGGSDLTLEDGDLQVLETDRRTTAATVVMLDVSHSMILYGEDRFTPAKQVALALAHLIRTRYPGDVVKFVLFHDHAEEVSLAKLTTARVGPYHTNTAGGLEVARRLLKRERAAIKQIVMITDGKPTALSMPDGRVYVNAMGLDPLVMGRTLREVAGCRRDGVVINTFMLARDPELVAFVRRVSDMTRGRATFTTPHTIGETVLRDYERGRAQGGGGTLN